MIYLWLYHVTIEIGCNTMQSNAKYMLYPAGLCFVSMSVQQILSQNQLSHQIVFVLYDQSSSRLKSILSFRQKRWFLCGAANAHTLPVWHQPNMTLKLQVMQLQTQCDISTIINSMNSRLSNRLPSLEFGSFPRREMLVRTMTGALCWKIAWVPTKQLWLLCLAVLLHVCINYCTTSAVIWYYMNMIWYLYIPLSI